MHPRPATSARRAQTTPACAIAVSAPVVDAATRSALIAVTAWLGARAMAIEMPKLPEMPKMPEMPELPKLPDLPKVSLPKISLPGQKKKESAEAAPTPAPVPRAPVPRGNVTIRAANIGTATPDAPTLAELTGQQSQDTIAAGEGWKRFPSRRMPGANMENWKKIAKEIGPKI